VNVEFLENIPHFLNKNEESAWQKASASLDASAKIYGYRVDCVHSDTFRFLSGLNRTDNKSDAVEDDERRERKNKLEKEVWVFFYIY
jgi:condensin complex subunit 2